MSVLGLDLGRARVTTQDGAGGVVSGVCFELTMDDGSRQTLSAAMLAPLLVGGAPPALVAALEPPPASSSVTDCFASSCLDAAHDAAHEPLPFNKEEDVTVVVPTATALSVDGGRAAAAAAGGAPAPAPAQPAAPAKRAVAHARVPLLVFCAASAACVAASGAVISRRFEVYGAAPRFVAVSAALERMRARRGDATYADVVFKITQPAALAAWAPAGGNASLAAQQHCSSAYMLATAGGGFVDPVWCANQPVYVPGCAGGFYGTDIDLPTPCPDGFFCPGGVTCPIACPPGAACARSSPHPTTALKCVYGGRGDKVDAWTRPFALGLVDLPSNGTELLYGPWLSVLDGAGAAAGICPGARSLQLCPAGRFCRTPSESAPCPAGRKCPPGSSAPRRCHGIFEMCHGRGNEFGDWTVTAAITLVVVIGGFIASQKVWAWLHHHCQHRAFVGVMEGRRARAAHPLMHGRIIDALCHFEESLRGGLTWSRRSFVGARARRRRRG